MTYQFECRLCRLCACSLCCVSVYSVCCVVQVNALLCDHAFRDHDMSCIDNCKTGPAGTCTKCGFARIWNDGLRRKLVTADSKLKAGVHPVWLTEMKQLGAIDKDSVAKVQAEIQQRLSQAKLLDKGLDQKLAGAHPAAAAAAGGGVGSLGR